jgi:nitroimidazol reductase NimA-like FMN-containing flavoprotein (pyridoxamine 5'-phosphate oxidase superfamily)
VGFYEEGEVYIVPLNFGYGEENGKLTFYFHSAGQGRKVELFRRGGRAGFELDCAHRLVRGEKACSYTEMYKSIIGTGRTYEVPEEEKLAAMKTVIAHYTDEELEYDPAMMTKVRLFALEVEELSCKEHV